jgi:hypothetical protein
MPRWLSPLRRTRETGAPRSAVPAARCRWERHSARPRPLSVLARRSTYLQSACESVGRPQAPALRARVAAPGKRSSAAGRGGNITRWSSRLRGTRGTGSAAQDDCSGAGRGFPPEPHFFLYRAAGLHIPSGCGQEEAGVRSARRSDRSLFGGSAGDLVLHLVAVAAGKLQAVVAYPVIKASRARQDEPSCCAAASRQTPN